VHCERVAYGRRSWYTDLEVVFFFLKKQKIIKRQKQMLFEVVPSQMLGQWSNVGVPQRMWGTKVEPGAEWYNNAAAPQ
jgi:hypothetical protein